MWEGERLADALKMRNLSVREFQRHIDGAAPGTSYPAVHRYLGNKGTPSLEFIEVAARILEVRPAWLAFGEGAAEEDDPEGVALLFQEDYVIAAIESLPNLLHGDTSPGLLRDDAAIQAALIRFSALLNDAGSDGKRWNRPGERIALLRAAYVFMVYVERAISNAEAFDAEVEEDRDEGLGRMLLMGSESSGWEAYWWDAVLNLFARRVLGLGERIGHIADAHSADEWRQLRSQRSRH